MKTLIYLSITLISSFNVFAGNDNDLIVTYTKTDVTCAGSNNGNITLSVSGGKMPYTVSWKHGHDQFEIENLHGGVYTAIVKDANGKKVTQQITIEEPSPLGFYYKSDKLTSVDEFNGIMDISIFGGSPFNAQNEADYFVRLNGKSYYQNPEKLEDGLYNLSIEDAKGCTFSLKVNINVNVVPHANAIELENINTVSFNNSFGVVNMFDVHHDLMNSSILQNFENETQFDFSLK